MSETKPKRNRFTGPRTDRYCSLLAMRCAAGMKIKDAAAEIGVSESRAVAVANSDKFKQQVNQMRTQMLQEAAGKLADAAERAIAVLVAALDDETPKIRLDAAKAILDRLAPIADLGELRARLDKMEGQV